MMHRFFHPIRWCLGSWFFFALHVPVFAQNLPSNVEQALRETQSEISRQRIPQPLPEQKEVDLWLPSDKSRTKVDGTDKTAIDATKVRVVGSTWLSAEQIRHFFSPLQGDGATLDTIRQVADKIEAKYREAGYFLARVLVPLQQDARGGLEMRVVEGYISDILIEGVNQELRDTLQPQLQQLLTGKRPISIGDFETAQTLARSIFGSESRIVLRPGKELGAAELLVALNTASVTPEALEAGAEISRLRIPQPLPEAKEYEIFIQQTEKTPVPKAVDELEFDLKAVRVEGSSYYRPEQVNAMFAHLIGQKVTLSDLRSVAEQLETRYREAGFFLTRVFLPPQQVKNGEFEIRVIEGYISAGFVEGGNDRVRARLEALLGQSIVGKKPLKLSDLERTLLVANDFPGYAVSSMLRQGTELGSSELVATLIELPNTHSFSFNNQSSNVTGPWSFAYSGTLNNQLGRGEQINIGVNAGNDFSVLRVVSFKYSEPIGYSGLVGSVGVLLSEARPSGLASNLNFKSDGHSFSTRLRYPYLRNRDHSLYLDTGLAFNRTQAVALGSELSHDKSTVWDTQAAYLYKTDNAGFGNARLGFSYGVNFIGSEPSQNAVSNADMHFTKSTFGAQHTYPISSQTSVLFSLNGQITANNIRLASGEEISFGGSGLGRAFFASAITGDSGLGGLVEFRYDLPIRNTLLLAPVQLYLFADTAKTIKNQTSNINEIKSLASYGVGARLMLERNISFDFSYANALNFYQEDDKRNSRQLTLSSSINF